MRVIGSLLSALLLLTVAAPWASAEVGDGTVYLERDSRGRYRPTVDDGGSTSVLADRDSITPPAVSPSGNRVAFSGVVGDGSLGLYALFVVDSAGGPPTQLTNGNLAEFDPVWVNGGQAIVFSQNVSGVITGNCCRLASVDVSTGEISLLTSFNGAQRAAAAPNGAFVYFDTASGVWRIPVGGGSATNIATDAFDAAVSGEEDEIVFLRDTGSITQLRLVAADGGSSVVLYSTANEIENPVWVEDRIHFIEHTGLGYDGRKSVTLRSISRTGGSSRIERRFGRGVVGVTPRVNGDELFVYRDVGEYRYFDVRPDGATESTIRSGSDYTSGWAAITSINLDGDHQDEMFFYRDDGLYRYYDIKADAGLGAPIRAGADYTSNWAAITAVDLGGDGQDEMFFYRDDGLYRYYDIESSGRIGAPIRAGSDYTSGWDAITAVNIDGDSGDEMFFYRSDGLYRFYEIEPSGRIGAPILAGDDYTTGWDAIVAIDLDGDDIDEIFFYREDGLYRYYDVRPSGRLGSPIREGDDFSTGWTSVSAVNLPVR